MIESSLSICVHRDAASCTALSHWNSWHSLQNHLRTHRCLVNLMLSTTPSSPARYSFACATHGVRSPSSVSFLRHSNAERQSSIAWHRRGHTTSLGSSNEGDACPSSATRARMSHCSLAVKQVDRVTVTTKVPEGSRFQCSHRHQREPPCLLGS